MCRLPSGHSIMNPPAEPQRPRTSLLSSEAIIGIGLTIAAVGLMCLLLGLAQFLREVERATWILVPLGALLLILGAVATVMAQAKARRR